MVLYLLFRGAPLPATCVGLYPEELEVLPRCRGRMPGAFEELGEMSASSGSLIRGE